MITKFIEHEISRLDLVRCHVAPKAQISIFRLHKYLCGAYDYSFARYVKAQTV